MRRVIFSLVFTCAAWAQLVHDAAGHRGVTPEDYFAFEQAGDPQISPDGKSVAYTVTTIDQKANRRVSRIWVSPVDAGHPPVAYTAEGVSSTSPRWSPDGRFI